MLCYNSLTKDTPAAQGIVSLKQRTNNIKIDILYLQPKKPKGYTDKFKLLTLKSSDNLIESLRKSRFSLKEQHT